MKLASAFKCAKIEPVIFNSDRRSYDDNGELAVTSVKVCGYTHPDAPGLAIEVWPDSYIPVQLSITHLRTGRGIAIAKENWSFRTERLANALYWMLELAKVVDFSTLETAEAAEKLGAEDRDRVKNLLLEMKQERDER